MKARLNVKGTSMMQKQIFVASFFTDKKNKVERKKKRERKRKGLYEFS
jgi:hypothetical protein